jgi:hypothetical protein
MHILSGAIIVLIVCFAGFAANALTVKIGKKKP